MTVEEKQQHLNNISRGITAVQSEVSGMSYQEFEKAEQTKEAVYALLQQIGQAAHELAQGAGEHGDLNYMTDILSEFRNARYNQEAEVGHQQIYNIINNDLEDIRKRAIEVSAELESHQMGDGF
ncbi:MAG: hypothetical protein ACNS60_08880 [Candidatus Cyclobacteriaceae bacterium M2_1C_046]